MNKNEVLTVKIYFINPIEIISVVINALIELEFETYTVNDIDKAKLLKIMPENNRNVVFCCINNKREISDALEYSAEINKITSSQNSFAVFAYDNMTEAEKKQFLEKNIAVINYLEIKKDTLAVLKKILLFFEAKGKRANIRVKTIGENKAYFYFIGKDEPVIGKVIDLSSYAFSCEIESMYKSYFSVNDYIDEVVLVLRGLRIKTAIQIMGFSQEKSNLFILKFCNVRYENNKMHYEGKISAENNRKVHNYIQKTLKENLNEKFKEIKES